MTTVRIYWRQRQDIHKEHFYSKDDDELYWKTYSHIAHSFYVHPPARAIIVPNVGWRYCAKLQAKAYRQIDFHKVKKVFIFAPILTYYCNKMCCLASVDAYLNPLFRMSIDPTIYAELEDTKMFDRIAWKPDEKELTIEAQLPFITTLLHKYEGQFNIVPVYVGELGLEEQKIYGAIFSKYLNDPNNVFILSTNFHHWGKYFEFTHKFPTDKTAVQTLDKLVSRGIEAIQPLNPEKYMDYCLFTPGKFVGQHVIGILMYAIQTIKNGDNTKINAMEEEERVKAFYTKFYFKFLDKGFSNPYCTDEDHCFSYACGSLVMTREKLIPEEPVPDAPLDKRV